MAGLAAGLGPIVGARAAKILGDTLELHTIGDLLRHYPRRYDDRAAPTDLSGLREGDHVTVLATIDGVSKPRRLQGGRSMLDVRIGDGHRTLSLVFFFKGRAYLANRLTPGRQGLFAGTVSAFRGKLQLAHPRFTLLDGTDDDAVEDFAGGTIPVYPATAKCDSWTIARCVRLALQALDPPPDPLPADVRTEYALVDLATALHDVHRPPDRAALQAARQRLKWDEALGLQVTLAQRRHEAAGRPATPRPDRPDGLRAAFDDRLPFTLTAGQREIGTVLTAELARAHPMHRLLQGEVGSGKTVCALRAMLQVVDAGGQAALLAPTEVLAQQHYRSLRELLGPLGAGGELGAAERSTAMALLVGSQGASSRRAALTATASGDAGIVVGTHALLQEGVEFGDLGLVVVDEQHRFGVEQRDALRAKAAEPPHVLVMTATPIPRTVAMTVYGDLETSALTELPGGRSPIATHVVPASDARWVDRTWRRLREEVAKGHQAYVVCPRIGEATAAGEDVEGDDADPAEPARRPPLAVLDVAPMLLDGPLAGLRVAILHGRLPGEEKDAVMRAFAAGEVDVLVATTVVEVGVDVPNATVMVVMDADRFGVSQLHQLRGRVGRGAKPGLCLLWTDAATDSPARPRLEAVAATLDGFRLAELDLAQRREGDVLGAAQHGRRSQLRLLSLLEDRDLITAARAAANRIVAADPDLHGHPALAAAVAELVDADRAEYLEKA